MVEFALASSVLVPLFLGAISPTISSSSRLRSIGGPSPTPSLTKSGAKKTGRWSDARFYHARVRRDGAWRARGGFQGSIRRRIRPVARHARGIRLPSRRHDIGPAEAEAS